MTFNTSFRAQQPLSESKIPIPPVETRTQVVSAGTVVKEGARALSVDIQVDEDQPITLRDGVVLYGDVYRPSGNSGSLPAVLMYTPYSKRGGYWNTAFYPVNFGVPPQDLTGLNSFEALDPGYWCEQGYAIVVVDSRGTSNSGGDMRFMGAGEGEDAYDVIEWIAAQPWSNGAVGMAGNSKLCITQWAAAALNPPHLKAIAPWEGLTDLYRDVLVRGGIPDTTFNERDIYSFIYGKGQIEDIAAMTASNPLFDEYWASKVADLSQVTAAAYVGASWSNPIHTKGTLGAYAALPAETTWMRIHDTQEWIDLADPASVADLQKFFDRYLKGEQNGWESTPRVRYTVLDPGGVDETNLVAPQWPLASQPAELFLNGNDGSLTSTAPTSDGVTSYASTDLSSAAKFSMVADKDMTIFGALTADLWVSTDAGNDLDVFVAVYKEDADGNRLHHITLRAAPAQAFVRSLERDGMLPAAVAYTGPVGRLRASHRALDDAASTRLEPVHTHMTEDFVTQGEPVELQIDLWPTAMKVHAGERLVVEIAGHPTGPLAMHMPGESGLPGGDIAMSTRNQGTHSVYTGGNHASRLLFAIL